MSKPTTIAKTFEVIATRTLEIVDGSGSRVGEAVVKLGRPWQEPTGEWTAPYQIVGLRVPITSCMFGMDAIHALQLVQLVIGGALAGSDEGKAGRLRWDGDSDLGFPLPREPTSTDR
jgi:hypothetical protein